MKNNASGNNPFITSQAARGSDFFGREELLNRVNIFFSQNEVINFLIFGQRRSGKTSLLKKIQDKYRSEELLILYFNLQDRADADLEQFLLKISKRIKKYLNISEEQDAESNFESFALKHLKISNRQVVVLFDEFDVICNNSGTESETESLRDVLINYLSGLTGFVKKHKLKLKFIYAVGGNYIDNTIKKCPQLISICEKAELNDFKENSLKKNLNNITDIPFNKEAIDLLIDITSGSTYFTLILAHQVYDFAYNHNAEVITPKMVNKQFVPCIKSFSYGISAIWNDLKPYDKIILYLSAHLGDKSIEISHKRILNKAKELKINFNHENISDLFSALHKNNFFQKFKPDKYKFKNEFFRKWITTEIGKREILKLLKDL